jgi:hypothetical protein
MGEVEVEHHSFLTSTLLFLLILLLTLRPYLGFGLLHQIIADFSVLGDVAPISRPRWRVVLGVTTPVAFISGGKGLYKLNRRLGKTPWAFSTF